MPAGCVQFPGVGTEIPPRGTGVSREGVPVYLGGRDGWFLAAGATTTPSQMNQKKWWTPFRISLW